jgi:hypothetical protein
LPEPLPVGQRLILLSNLFPIFLEMREDDLFPGDPVGRYTITEVLGVKARRHILFDKNNKQM